MSTAATAAAALASLLEEPPLWLPPVSHWEVAEDTDSWIISGQLAGDMPEAPAFRLLAPMMEIAPSQHSDNGRTVKVPFVWEGVTGQVWYLRPTRQWPVTDVEVAVRELGALPVPVGPEPRAVEDVTPQVAKLRALLAGQRDAVADDLLSLAPAWHVTATYNPTFQTIELDLTTTTDEWTAWQEVLHVDLARTTNRGSCTTSHAVWRGIHVVIRRWAAPSEGEHYAAVHHDYRVSRDLPVVGGGA